ncbi:type V CRISPR-associated protein Cas12b [Deferrisoma sp.]
MNRAVAHYENLLLEMRQADVCVGQTPEGEDEIAPAAVWKNRLEQRLRDRGVPPERRQEACELLREFYGHIVASSRDPGRGSAQDARNYHDLLVSAGSASGQADEHLLAVFDPVLQRYRTGDGWREPDEAWAEEARGILASNEELLNRTGRPPAWLVSYQNGDPGWPLRLFSDLQGKWSGDVLLKARLRALGVVPLAAPFGEGLIRGTRGNLTKYERMAFALAVGHLNPWETGGHRARVAYQERLDRLVRWDERWAEPLADALAAIRRYEEERTLALERLAEGLGAAPRYRVGFRELRGWPRVREWLLAHPGAPLDERKRFLAQLQAENPRKFGGAELLAWLAHPDQDWLVRHPAGDAVQTVAERNYLERLLERTRQHPVFTFAEAREHPRFAEFDPPKNQNQPPYDLASPEPGKLTLTIRLLTPADGDPSGPLEEQDFTFLLAPSGQARGAVVEEVRTGRTRGTRRDLVLRRRTQDRLGETAATVAGAALLFDRGHTERTGEEALADGAVGPVYFKVALDVVPEAGEEAFRNRKTTKAWFDSSLGERISAKGRDRAPTAPTRVLAVDLGLRSAAAIAVYEVEPATGADGAVSATPAYRLERSAVLRLPGEETDKDELARRREADDELFAVRREIRRLGTFRRICLMETPEERREALAALRADDEASGERFPFRDEDLAELWGVAGAPTPRWRDAAFRLYREAERRLGERIAQWRRRTRELRTRGGGKSAWAVEHLERVYRTLLAWHRHQPPWRPEVQRLDRERFGSVARRLREHFVNLREDRAKTTADLIVQAARGLVYEDGRWTQRFDPVDLIVFEDLTRYRFRTDRPRAENRQLMRWMHREVRRLAEMQAEEYGIAVAETGAAFSSRFDATTGAPGVRCRALTAEDVAQLQAGAAPWLVPALEAVGIPPEEVRPGTLVPTGTGELLAYLKAGGLGVKHADINAAQNIGRRYITGHSDPVRLAVRPLETRDHGTVYVNPAPGKRLQGALGAAAVALVSCGDGADGYELRGFRTVAECARFLDVSRQALGAGVEDAEESGGTRQDASDADLELDAIEEAQAERMGERTTFFRDPSGQVAGGRWLPAKEFWGRVERTVANRLADRLPASGSPGSGPANGERLPAAG